MPAVITFPPEQMQESLGSVDLWINNAGTNSYMFKTLIETAESDLAEIVDTNVLGVMLCCQAAIKAMRQQSSGGHIFNMDGAGADGNATPRFAAYGATKRSLVQFQKSLIAEMAMAGINNVGIHNLSPGVLWHTPTVALHQSLFSTDWASWWQ